MTPTLKEKGSNSDYQFIYSIDIYHIKTFDKVNRQVIRKMLRERSLPLHLTRATRSLYKERTIKIENTKKISNHKFTTNFGAVI